MARARYHHCTGFHLSGVLVVQRGTEARLCTIAGRPGNGTISPSTDPKMVATMRHVVNAMFERTYPFVRERYPVEICQDILAGIEVIRVRPAGGVPSRNKKRILLNVHGGSFMVGWPSVALLDAVPIATNSGI